MSLTVTVKYASMIKTKSVCRCKWQQSKDCCHFVI
nr:MAG TPA: Protein of unknown function (DUF3709) [Caudoviricetes sp.]